MDVISRGGDKSAKVVARAVQRPIAWSKRQVVAKAMAEDNKREQVKESCKLAAC